MKEEETPPFTLLLADYCDLVDRMGQLVETSKEWKLVYDMVNRESMRMIQTARKVQGGQCNKK